MKPTLEEKLEEKKKSVIYVKNSVGKEFDDQYQKTDREQEIFELFFKSGIKCISGKYFDKDDNPISDIRQEVQKIAIKRFKKPLKPVDYKYALESIDLSPNSDQFGTWKPLPLWREALEDYQQNISYPEAFDLTAEQYVIIYYYIFKPEAELFWIVSGVGGSGKSTFLNIMKQLYENDVSSTPISELSKEFVRAKAIESRLICSDEINADALDNGIIKTLVSKQALIKNMKGLTPIEVKTQSALLYCCNREPKIDITDTGLLRRVRFYRRDTKILNPDPKLKDKKFTREDLKGFLINSIKVYNRLVYTYQRDPLSLFNKDTEYFLLINNNVAKFFNKCKQHNIYNYDSTELDVFGEEVGDSIYQCYSVWAKGKGFRPYNYTNFCEICKYIISIKK